jgi:hypothetical protein
MTGQSALKRRKLTQPPPAQNGRNEAWSGRKGNLELAPLDETLKEKAR